MFFFQRYSTLIYFIQLIYCSCYFPLYPGVQSGSHPDLSQLMKDKYDEELDLAKSLIQQDFDEAMKEEKVNTKHSPHTYCVHILFVLVSCVYLMWNLIIFSYSS